MSIFPELQKLSLAIIAYRCAEESSRFVQRQDSDPRYCFELFRRALAERNQQAWDLIYKQYHTLIGRWVRRHPSYKLCDEETQYFINRAFERLWSAIIPDNFGRFSDLKSILRYLQMCAASSVMDYLRRKEQNNVLESVKLSPIHSATNPGDIENMVLNRTQQVELWQSIDKRLNSEKERKVVYGTFILNQKPRQIHAEFTDLFANAAEVSRIKENVLARLKRDQALLTLLGNA